MAKVVLRNNWFAPNAQLFRKSRTKKGPPVDIPDELVPYLPTTAIVIEKFLSGRMIALGMKSSEDFQLQEVLDG